MGGGFDPEFARWSNALIEDFRAGRLKPVISDIIAAMTRFDRIVKEQGTTVVMASHDPLGDEYADLIVRLQDGQIVTAA